MRAISAIAVAFAAVLMVPSVARGQEAEPWRLDLSEPVTYHIAEVTPDSRVTERDRTLALWALGAWATRTFESRQTRITT